MKFQRRGSLQSFAHVTPDFTFVPIITSSQDFSISALMTLLKINISWHLLKQQDFTQDYCNRCQHYHNAGKRLASLRSDLKIGTEDLSHFGLCAILNICFPFVPFGLSTNEIWSHGVLPENLTHKSLTATPPNPHPCTNHLRLQQSQSPILGTCLQSHPTNSPCPPCLPSSPELYKISLYVHLLPFPFLCFSTLYPLPVPTLLD